jgi:hypothetical protein
MNYNEEVTTHIVNEYNKEPSTETVQKLSEELGKSTKSIIGKLSREGVYQRATYKNKTGELPVTKVELVNNIAENLGIEVENLLGLEKAPKATLKYLDPATGIQETEKDWREGTVWERSIDPS